MAVSMILVYQQLINFVQDIPITNVKKSTGYTPLS